jgi:predicted secreted Zn-dependent protease
VVKRHQARRTLALVSAASIAGCAAQPRLDVGLASPGVTVDAKIQYYDVNAATMAEMQRAMLRDGVRIEGRTWSAVTNWNVRWTYQYASLGPLCEITHVRVNVRAVVTLPRWNPTANPDSSLLAWWEQFNRGLAEHERGHALLAVAAGKDIVQALEGLTGGPCDVLGARANDLGNRFVSSTKSKQEQYDRETRHGATQIRQAGRLAEP